MTATFEGMNAAILLIVSLGAACGLSSPLAWLRWRRAAALPSSHVPLLLPFFSPSPKIGLLFTIEKSMAAVQLGLIPLSCALAYFDGRKVGLLDNDASIQQTELEDHLKECIEQTPFQQLLGPGNLVLRRLHRKAATVKRLVSRQAEFDAATTTHLSLISTAFNVRRSPCLPSQPLVSCVHPPWGELRLFRRQSLRWFLTIETGGGGCF